MKSDWKKESVGFDRLYCGDTLVSRIPYIGRFVRQGLTDRMEWAITFAGAGEGKTILDLGCGIGRFALEVARRGAVVFGYDISAQAIEIAKQKARQAGLEDRCFFQEADLTELKFPEADTWVDLGCLQYIQDASPVLAKLGKIKRCFSCLPRRGHWLNPVRFLYRGVLKGTPYETYTQDRIKKLFWMYPDLAIERNGAVYYVTSDQVEGQASHDRQS